MANTSSKKTYDDEERARILKNFQEITELNFEDSILFLNEYNWKLDAIIDDYYKGIDLKQKYDHNPSLGRYYSNEDENKSQDTDIDHYYPKLLNSYEETTTIYHEKQRLKRCGLHSLNNLFQIPKLFTRHYLEEIAQKYDKRKVFNDYATLWLGNYDLRILIEAIQNFGYHVRQIDFNRKESLSTLPWNTYFGLLINLNNSHWFTIKNLNGIYYNLDSTLRKPLQIGHKDRLIEYLIRLINRTRKVYLFVVSEQKEN